MDEITKLKQRVAAQVMAHEGCYSGKSVFLESCGIDLQELMLSFSFSVNVNATYSDLRKLFESSEEDVESLEERVRQAFSALDLEAFEISDFESKDAVKGMSPVDIMVAWSSHSRRMAIPRHLTNREDRKWETNGETYKTLCGVKLVYPSTQRLVYHPEWDKFYWNETLYTPVHQCERCMTKFKKEHGA